MWTRVLLKPFWARALVVVGVCAILDAVQWCASWLGSYHLADDPYQNVYTLAGHVAGIVIFGILVAAFTSNSHYAYANALAGLDPAQRSAALDSSFRGPVPVDAPVRDAAIRLGQRRLGSALFWRQMWLVLLGLTVLAAGAGLARAVIFGTWAPSGWNTHDWISFAVGLAVVLCFTVAAWYVPLSVKHRLETLTQTGDFDVKSMGEAR